MIRPKTIMITGASGKLGTVMVNAALREGYRVIATYHNHIGQYCLPSGADNLLQIQLDLLSGSSLNKCVEDIAENGEEIDVLVHNARSRNTLQCDAFGWSDEQSLIDEYRMAVSGPYRLTHELMNNGLRPRQIVFVNSIYGKVTPNRNLYSNPSQMPPAQYGIAKAAQLKLSQELAVRLADQGVRVNSLVLGGVQGRADADFVSRYENLCPQRQMLNDQDVEEIFLASLNPKLRLLTGQEWLCDGGWTLW